MTARALVLAVLLSACGNGTAGNGTRVHVLAAASLSGSLGRIARAYEAAEPGVRVATDFGGSAALASQITAGAGADVFAAADLETMERLREAHALDGDPVVFARNRLQIVVEPGNPKRVSGLADLARLTVVTCAPVVPCGRYAEQALHAAGVRLTPVSHEDSVKGVVAKVSLGEADAGIVYATDVLSAGRSVSGVPIPDDENVVASYPVAVLRTARDRAAAMEFVRFLLSTRARSILTGAGFLLP